MDCFSDMCRIFLILTWQPCINVSDLIVLYHLGLLTPSRFLGQLFVFFCVFLKRFEFFKLTHFFDFFSNSVYYSLEVCDLEQLAFTRGSTDRNSEGWHFYLFTLALRPTYLPTQPQLKKNQNIRNIKDYEEV